MDIKNNKILSISEITYQVKSSLKNSFSNIWIKGEISSIKTYSSGHMYLTLKDEFSEISSVMFSQYKKLLSYTPKIGMEVIVIGDLSIYVPRGQFQLQIKNLFLTGEGELWASFEKLKNKLTREGLFDSDHKIKIPKYPERIGIITSSEGSVLHDMLRVINRRAPYLKCFIYSVPVQGIGAAEKISQAIDDMNIFSRLDVLIIGRGGGSIEDLWCFNEEIVIRSIFRSKIPIISAIGHETDTTLSDYVSDVRASTPSVAAEIISLAYEELIQNLDYLQGKMIDCFDQKINYYSNKMSILEKQMEFFNPINILDRMKEKLDNNSNSLQYSMNNMFEKKMNHLKLIREKLTLLDPESHLNRGYAIALDANNNVIYDSDDLEIDDILQLKISKGKLKAKVIEKETQNA